MLQISNKVTIPSRELDIRAVRAQGPGGQHVNKASTAIHLRFDIRASSLPDSYKQRLLAYRDHRITRDGVIVIKAQDSRSQDANREAALQRLRALIKKAMRPPKKRKATKPTKASQQRRLDRKKKHSAKKKLRGRVE